MDIPKVIIQFLIWGGYVFMAVHAIVRNWVLMLEAFEIQGPDFIFFMMNSLVTIFFVGLGWCLYQSFFGELKED